MEDEERRRKLEAGKAKLAQFRQRKAHSDSQNVSKKQKKRKKVSNTKDDELVQESLDIEQSQGEDASLHSCQRGATATSDFAIVRTLHSGEVIKHDQTYTAELESETSTTANDYSSELQEFEAAIKKRDDIIAQLTANLQQARKEKDETMREFLDLTDQSQKLQIQFRHLQASEALRNTSHSSTAADLLQAKQQILAYQQQLEEQEQLLKNHQMKNEDLEVQVSFLQQRASNFEMEKFKAVEDSSKRKLKEKETLIEELEAKIIEEEENKFILQKKLSAAEKSLEEVKAEIFLKNQEIHKITVELTSSKQKERQCSDEIKQLMGTVEELQKRCHKDGQLENDIVQRMELDAEKRLADLRAELEEMHGQQIVQMKQELVREHTTEIEKLLAQQKADLERTLNLHPGNTNEDKIHLMNIAINELNLMLQDANYQREKVRQDLSQQLERVSSEKSSLQNKVEDLCQDLNFAREQLQTAKQTIHEKESKLHEVDKLQIAVGDLKAQLASASEIKKELELKHEAEVTNYKIKLEMLEREKDAVLDRMAESLESELERLRTQLLFSHEEELSKLRDDLQEEHRINIENLKDNLAKQYKQQLNGLQNEMSKKIETMQFENDNLITQQNQLMLEITRLKDLQETLVNSKSEEMTLQIYELQKEIEVLRQEEKEKGTLEQEVQELQLKTELLEKQMKEKEDSLHEKCTLLDTQNRVLEGEVNALQEKLKKYTVMNMEESLVFLDGPSPNSQDFDLQKRVENLMAENEHLIKQDNDLKEEIERLKNSFSLAERDFEHNYQELQEKYTSLLKVKSDLEMRKNKQESEYEANPQTEEILHLQGDVPVVLQSQNPVLHSKRERVLRSETFDVEEIIEKDTTELMEKLEVTQREKLELSLKLSELSEQLKLNHSKIFKLSEEVKSLKQDKEHISARCKELEFIASHKQENNMETCEHRTECFSEESQVGSTIVSGPGVFMPGSYKEFDGEIREEKMSSSLTHHVSVEEANQEKLNLIPQSLLDNFNEMNVLAGDSSHLSLVQTKNKLQEQLAVLKSEQNDLKLQMEAQRICLSLVYSAHVDQVREHMENDKENALSALKEELQLHHAQELCDLKKNFLDSQIKKDESGQSTWHHLDGLSKTIAEECSKLSQSLCNILHKKSLTATEPDAVEQEKAPTILMSIEEAQEFHGTLQTLLSKIMEEYDRLLKYHVQFMKDRKKAEDHQKLCAGDEEKEFGVFQRNIESSPTQLQDTVDGNVRLPCLEDMKNLQSQLEEKHVQEIERLHSYFHQQLKETEERYSTEIALLQSSLQDAKESSECFSISVKSQGSDEGEHAESGLGQSIEKTIEKENEVGVSNEVESVELLEKQYQEKLLEEIAKVASESSASSIESSSQISLYEERLEDMRQELVRQYQEHQQTTEMLKQGHMQQMERQKENQEQLLAELDRLKVQLEQSETAHQAESTEPVLESEDREGNHEESSLDILSKDRSALQKTNSRLLKILLEVVKTTVAVEETIGRHVVGLLDRSSKCQLLFNNLAWETRTEEPIKTSVHVGYETEKPSSYHGSDLEGNDCSMWSEVTEEGLGLTQYLTEHGFTGVEINSENEELVLNISSRLQAAVEKLLEAINETTNQLEHAKVTQTELMRESFKRDQETTEFLKCQEELQERLDEEVKAREQLALELSKAENLIDGYADEKALLEKQIQEKIDAIDHLEQELLCTGNKLQELEAERQQLQEEKELLFRQKDAMKADAGPIEQRLVDAAVDAASQAELLAETEKLMKEKIEVQRQAEKEYDYLQKQVKALETDIEEQVNQFLELEQEKNAEVMDLRQQNQALEKQLEKTKKFLDEQAIDREHERDVFQQEIQKLEQQLKVPQRFQPVNEHQTREVEQLTIQLKEKTDRCSELLLSKEQFQRDIQERNEEIEKLECRIREMEQALMISADSLQKVEERKQFGSVTLRGEVPLEAQLQAEQEAVDRKEKEVINLEEQLEQFREELENKNEEVQQLHMQLEIQRKESSTRQQELEHENNLFKEEMKKLSLAIQSPEDTSTQDHHPVVGKFVQIMHEKEQEINELHEQISKLQQQLEITTDNKVIEEKNEHIRELEAQIEYLKSDQDRLKQNSEQEIEQLNEVIEKLQQELANIEHKIPLESSFTQEEADNLKHQLDVVLAEKESLVNQMENNQVELTLAKNELGETKLKVSKLMEEVDALREAPDRMGEKHDNIQVSSGVAETGAKIKDLEAVNHNTTKTLENEIPPGSMDENAKDSFGNADRKFQQLLKALEEKDSELIQCYSQIKDLKEETQAESEELKQRITKLEETLKQALAVVLVSEAQLNVVLEQNKLFPEAEAASEGAGEDIKNIPTEEVNSTVEEEAKARLSVFFEKLQKIERQLADAHRNLQVEKSKVDVAQKEAKEKEEKLIELRQLLHEVEEKHKLEETQHSEHEKMQMSLIGTELHGERKMLTADPELERLRAESASAKEELNSHREKAEKIKEELMIKETLVLHLQEELRQTKAKLAHAEGKLADYGRKETRMNNWERVCTKEGPPISRMDASCQTDKAVHINSGNQSSQPLVKNEEIQIDLQNGCSSEEVAEIIREFSEKIDQMQELHAAEIMDMETRHISESEALKREKIGAVQELAEECNTLKDIIEALRNKEGIPCVEQTASSNARDGCSSDSSSDWSQGAYVIPNQGSDNVLEGMGVEGETATDFLPKKIKGLLSAIHQEGVQVLSLTEFPYGENDALPLRQGPELWLEERKAFLNTVSSLKDLIAKMQIHQETELYAESDSSEGALDWRTELLYAVQQVFQREKDVLLAAFQTELAEAGVRNVMVLTDQLEKRLREQGTYQRTAMDCIQHADRRSLLMETKLLHAQLNNRRTDTKRELEMEPKCQELRGYNMEMPMELSNTDRVAELQEQLSSERMIVADLKNELGQIKLELETTLKAQHKHLRDLEGTRNELKGKAAELDTLTDTLVREQKKSRELQWALEKEKTKMDRSEERRKEELEDLKCSLENEKQNNIELKNLLELERQLSNDLQKQVESQETLTASQLSQERSCNSELQVLLESERFRTLELSSALEREKELCAQLQMAEQKRQDGTFKPAEELLQELQKQLDEKHVRIVTLLSETERFKLESVQLKQQVEKERQIQRRTLQIEQDANILVQKKVHELESKVEDLQWQLGEKRQQVYQLQCEEKKLQEKVQELQQKEQQRESEVDKASCQNLNETSWDTSNERTRKWVFQQKMGGAETNELSYSALIGMRGGGDATGESQDLQAVRQRLRNVSSTLKQLANKAALRLPFEKADDEDFVRVQNNVEEILLELQMLPGLETETNSELPSSASFTERLLKQNAKLTGFVSRLSEEKNNLRNAVMKLEEELTRHQQKGFSGDSSFRPSLHNGGNVDLLIASEREIWHKEKWVLQQSLKQAEAELAKLRAELRNETFVRELGSDSENTALKRIYGRYLRAESFRKALIYQKKYLLLLLGGFQECEEATISLIARMGGQPSYTSLEVITHRSKGFTRFRSVVRVLIAISRMKFLVHRWHRVTGYGLISVSRDGFSQNMGNELRPESFSSGLELYGEHKHSYRSRSELESFRSHLSYQHRYQGIHTDLSPVSVACSQLQNYDPDRALTDYINRLEALQRRLGSVQSAPALNTQLHSGIRR